MPYGNPTEAADASIKPAAEKPISIPEASYLLKLPLERRLIIYDELLATCGLDEYSGLLSTNKQIKDEMEHAFTSRLRKELQRLQTQYVKLQKEMPDECPIVTIEMPISACEAREQIVVHTDSSKVTTFSYGNAQKRNEYDKMEYHYIRWLLYLDIHRLVFKFENTANPPNANELNPPHPNLNSRKHACGCALARAIA